MSKAARRSTTMSAVWTDPKYRRAETGGGGQGVRLCKGSTTSILAHDRYSPSFIGPAWFEHYVLCNDMCMNLRIIQTRALACRGRCLIRLTYFERPCLRAPYLSTGTPRAYTPTRLHACTPCPLYSNVWSLRYGPGTVMESAEGIMSLHLCVVYVYPSEQ